MTGPDRTPVQSMSRDHVWERWREQLATGVITVHTTPWHQDDLAAQLLAYTPDAP